MTPDLDTTHTSAPDTALTPHPRATSPLALVREQPRSTSPRDVIQESFALITGRTEETVGYGVALLALNMGLNGFLQFGLQTALVILVMLCVAAMSVSETAGTLILLTGGSVVVGVSTVLSLAVQTGIMGGYQVMWLKMLRKKDVTLDDVKLVRPFLLPLVGASLLSTLAILAGSVAFVLPGIFLATTLSLTPFFVLDRKMSVREALLASHRATRGHRLELFGLLCLLVVANMLGLMACGLGLFVSYPLSLGALATFYHRLIEPGQGYEPEQLTEDEETHLQHEAMRLPQATH